MQGEPVFYALLAALAIALVIAAYTDLRRREIDNWLTLAITLGAPVYWYVNGFNWLDISLQVAIAAATFGVVFVLFILNQMGGGDVKLLAALALWIRPVPYLQLLVVMAFAGALITVVLFAWRLARKHKGPINVPYGIAISFAGLWVLADQYWERFLHSGLVSGT